MGDTRFFIFINNDKTKEMEFISTYQKIEHDTSYAENIIENAYLDELKAFVYMIKGDASYVKYDFEKDREILQLIDRIEK